MPDEAAEVEVPEVPEVDGVDEVAQPAIPAEKTGDPGVKVPGLPPMPELAPYEQLQGARSKLNAALGSIDGSDLAITKAEEQVGQLESELETAQVNVAFARQDALGYRQRLHDACGETLAAIRLLKAKYPLD